MLKAKDFECCFSQTPFNTQCLKFIDYLILICIFLICSSFVLSVTIPFIALARNVGRFTFSVIFDSINGLIDLGIPDGLTILHMSARSGNTKGCERILHWKSHYYDQITINGETALTFAASKGHKNTCEKIVQMSRVKDGTTNDFYTIAMALNQDRNGLTALHKAVEANHPEVVNYLGAI